MIPILRVIASSIKRFFTRSVVTVGDPYWDNVVLNMRMEASDPYWDKKVLGLHCDGTNGSTTFIDVKGNTVTANGNAQISTAQYPTLTGKTSSAYFDGTGDYLSVPDSTDWAFGSGDFTLRAKIRLTAYATLNAGNYVACVISQHVLTQHSFLFYILGTSTSYTTLSFEGHDSAPSNTTINATYNFSLNTWYDIECCRSGNLIYMFVDGILINSGGSSFSKTLKDSTTTLKIGSLEYDATYKYAFPGYISEIEIYKGVALHTASFNLSADPFPEPAPVDDTGKTVTVTGNAILQGTTKKYGTGAMYFDGTGDYLTVADSSDFYFGANNYTLELWVNWSSLPGNGISSGLFGKYVTGTNNRCFYLELHNYSGVYSLDYSQYSSGTTTPITTVNYTFTPSLSTWYHIAICRIGSTLKIFINGLEVASGTATDIYSGTIPLSIGVINSAYASLNGYIDDLRITKGVARYTANFTPTYIESGALAGDPYYNYTSLLLKMNGADASTTFTDSSYSPKTCTANGNAQLKTANYRYGTASGYFDGTGDYVSFASDSAFGFGTGDFTIECWVNPSTPVQLYPILVSNGVFTSSGHGQIQVGRTGTGNRVQLWVYDYSQVAALLTSTNAVVNGAWCHLAVTRSGSSFALFLNGALEASATFAGAYGSASDVCVIGSDGSTSQSAFAGYIDDLRITKGIARYTANFTPPGSHIATQHPDTDPWWLNTVLALRMDGTSGSTTFTDLKGKTVTAVGNASVSLAQSKFGQAAYFDGTGDCITIPYTSDFDFGALDFTIEMWAYKLGNTAGGQRLWNSNGDYYGNVDLSFDASGNLSSGGTSNGTTWNAWASASIVAVTDNIWHHIALVRNGGDVYAFLNGTKYILTTSLGTTALVNGTNGATSRSIGGQSVGTNRSLNGYIDDVRVTKGIARYTANFTPSEKPLPTNVIGLDHDSYWQNVVLALPFDTDLSDRRGKTVTAYGNAAVSNAQKKFGSGSCFFDGTGDYLSVAHSGDLSLSNLDFTIEGWVYFNSVSGIQSILDPRGTTNDYACAYEIGLSGAGHTGKIQFAADTAAYNTNGSTWDVDLYSTTSAAINTWYHVAVTRSGSSWKLFINGVQEASTTSSITIGAAAPTVYVGSGVSGAGTIGNNLNGYVDDLRVTKGVARYTAGFNLPTTANILG